MSNFVSVVYISFSYHIFISFFTFLYQSGQIGIQRVQYRPWLRSDKVVYTIFTTTGMPCILFKFVLGWHDVGHRNAGTNIVSILNCIHRWKPISNETDRGINSQYNIIFHQSESHTTHRLKTTKIQCFELASRDHFTLYHRPPKCLYTETPNK